MNSSPGGCRVESLKNCSKSFLGDHIDETGQDNKGIHLLLALCPLPCNLMGKDCSKCALRVIVSMNMHM